MYEAPKLNFVGDAQHVVLGYTDAGLDLDGTHFNPDWEYGDDQLPPPGPWNL